MNSFAKVFEKINLSANVVSNLKNTDVSKLIVSLKQKEINVGLVSCEFVDESCLNDFNDDLKAAFPGVEAVNTYISYDISGNDEEKIALYYDTILANIKNISEFCYAIMQGCKFEFKDGKLSFFLSGNTSYSFYYKKIDIYIQTLLKERFGLDCKVEFVGRAYTEEELDIIEKKVNEVIERGMNEKAVYPTEKVPEQKLQPRKPAVDDKKFRRRTSNAIVGDIDSVPMSITKAYEVRENVTIEGLVLDEAEIRETKNGSLIVKAFIADAKNCIIAKMFSNPEVYERDIASILKQGAYVKISGNISEDTFERNEPVLSVTKLCKGDKPEERSDNAAEKRVELHLHTNMSMMDAVTPASDYIKRAAAWGHKAIAITDHGVVQAFPEALKTYDSLKKSGKDIKIIYGCEGYLVDDMGTAVRNCKNESLDSSCVVFDLETTGLHSEVDKIIEIGAVKTENGKIVDRFSTFVNPNMHITEEITKLTSITDYDVKDAPFEDDVLPKFLDFVGDSVLVAHNALFDVGFIRKWAKEKNIDINNTIVDTVEIGKILSPGIKDYKLDTLCNEYDVKLEHHHRAVDDAEATANLFIAFTEKLKGLGKNYFHEINPMLDTTVEKRNIRPYYHIILLAQNQTGLKNLYTLVSDSHIKYFNRRPKIPKSELIKYREGLILGSACEAGELYDAVYRNFSENEIKEIVDFYDYLEIQPLGNNAYMIGNKSKSGKSVKDESRIIEINKKITELGDIYKKPVVATCDCHFIDPEDEVYRRIVQTGDGYKDVDDQAPLFFRTTEEMLGEFEYLGKDKAYEVVITNTNKVADMIGDVLPIPRETYPPHMENADEDFERISYEKAHSIYGDELPEIVEKRLRRELDSIISNGYAVLYMIAQKLVWNSEENGYIVGSRGSVGSSFAATMAGITEVNPLQPHYVCKKCKYSDFTSDEVMALARESMSGFDLPDKLCPVCGEPLHKDGQAIPFETFLGFDGDKEPDIDLNFSGEYQTRAHKYCETLFKEGHVFKAGTISTLQEKTVYGYINKYCELHDNMVINSAEKKRLAMGCVGVKRSTGQHPGGLMVVPDDNDILNFTPVQRPANDFSSDVTSTHFDYHSISGRLLKLDMLGHDVPTIIKMLGDITGVDPMSVPVGAKEVVSLFTSPEALGVTKEDIDCETGSWGIPEFGTKFVRQMLMDTKPTTFSELVRISGLSHGTAVWIGNAADLVHNGVVKLRDVIATRDDIMGYLINYGIEKLTAFTIMEFVRKGKAGKDKEKWQQYEALMREHSVPEWYIESCHKIQYLFPKGHAVAYVTNSLRIAYFKVHHPLAFYAATFSVKYEDFDYNLLCFGIDKVKEKMADIDSLGEDLSPKDKTMYPVLELTKEMYARGYKFTTIDLYASEATKFKVVKNENGEEVLLPPLCSLQGFGKTAAESLIAARNERRFDTIADMQERTGLGKKMIELLKENDVLGNMRETDQLTIFDF